MDCADVHGASMQEWSDWDTGAAPETVPGDWSDALPLCPRCFEEVGKLDHYCSQCGFAVGRCTPNIPFVNIPLVCEPFAIMWERLWMPRGEGVQRRVLYAALIVIAGLVSGYIWILLVALPLWWIRPRYPAGACQTCGYDLRASAGRCPECGAMDSAAS